MDYQINRFVVDVPESDEKSSADQLDMDFFLQRDYRKVILGTVRFPNGKPAPCSIVKFFKLRHATADPEITSDLEPIGHAIADENGQFLLGPVYPGDKIILKISYLDCCVNNSSTSPIKSTREPEDNDIAEYKSDDCELIEYDTEEIELEE